MMIDDWYTEGSEDEGGAEEDTETDEAPYHSLHLLDGDGAGLQPIRLASFLIRVRTLEGVAQFVA
jgi:hypothetical protein